MIEQWVIDRLNPLKSEKLVMARRGASLSRFAGSAFGAS